MLKKIDDMATITIEQDIAFFISLSLFALLLS